MNQHVTCLCVYVVLFITDTNGHGFNYRERRSIGITELYTNATNVLIECKFPQYLQMKLNSWTSGLPDITLNLRKHHTVSNSYPPTYLINALSRQVNSVKQSVEMYTSSAPISHILVQCMHSTKSKQFSISGAIVHDGGKYAINTIQPADTTRADSMLVSVRKGDIRTFHDHTISEKSRVHSIEESTARDRREVTHSGHVLTFTIDVLVVVDYNIYIKWLSSAEGQTEKQRSYKAKHEIRIYYNHVINGVDIRYQSIGFEDFQIRVNLSGIIIVENQTSLDESASEATPTRSQLANGTNEMDADGALKLFRSWINNTDGLPKHNHAILFTGYDLYTMNGNDQRTSHTSGLAFIGTLCDPRDSVSIVEEHGGFQSIGTTAHEIGHSLGALHDGENNTCRSEDRYIMAASGFGPVPEDKKYNPWVFSRCSFEYFKSYMSTLLIDGSTCLTDTMRDSNRKIDVHTSHVGHPGQHYSPDNQCRLIWGQTSYLCRGAEFGNASTLCTAMYCRDPSTSSDCVLHTAARGTSCGSKQWCMNGQCVYSTSAPSKSEPCVLGDQPGPAFNALTCEQLISQSASYCYQEKVRARCCNTCGSKYTYRKGCEYGDRIHGCLTWHCAHVFETRDIRAECCGTCNTGEIISTVSNTEPFVPQDGQPTATSPHFPQDGQHSTVPTIKWKTDMCTDSGNFAGLTCSDYIESRGSFVCYGYRTYNACCRICRRIRVEKQGCEYGDKVPSLCTRIVNITDLECDKYGKHCCASCTSPIVHSTAHTLVNPGHQHSSIALCLLLYILDVNIHS